MNRLIPFFLVLCSAAQAQDMPPYVTDANKCSIPVNDDFWSLEPSTEHPGEYNFTYTNNIAECSDTLKGVGVTAPDGFRVILYVEVGVNENDDELIYVIPEDIQYQPWPAEIYAPDSSEPYTIRLIPGVS